MTIQHTPGDWSITPDFDYIRAPVDAFGYTGGQVICCMYNPLDFAGCDPRVLELKSANARLIAAAPKILHALETALMMFPELGYVETIQEAIFKARGE